MGLEVQSLSLTSTVWLKPLEGDVFLLFFCPCPLPLYPDSCLPKVCSGVRPSRPFSTCPRRRGYLLCGGFGVRRAVPWCHHGSQSFIRWPYFSHSWFDRLQVRIAVRKRRTPPLARCQLAVLRALLQKGTCWTSSAHSRLRDLCESCGQAAEKCCSCVQLAGLTLSLRAALCATPLSPLPPRVRRTHAKGQDLWKGVSGVTSAVADDDVFGLCRLVFCFPDFTSLQQCLIAREIDHIENPKYHSLNTRLNAPSLLLSCTYSNMWLVLHKGGYNLQVVPYYGFFFNFLKIILCLAVLGLRCCSGFSLVAASGGSSLAAVHRLLVVASLTAEQGP